MIGLKSVGRWNGGWQHQNQQVDLEKENVKRKEPIKK